MSLQTASVNCSLGCHAASSLSHTLSIVKPLRLLIPVLITALIFHIQGMGSYAIVLYETDFEDFTPGADNLAGTDGWVATLTGQQLHGIDDEIIPGLGKSAFLGFAPPTIPPTSPPTVSVFRPLNYDPIAQGRPMIQFEALIAIADSRDDPDTPAIDESLRRDRFLVTVYNLDGEPLASVIYDNRLSTFGLWRNDGASSTDSELEFIVEEPQFLLIRIDFESNSWSAFLDGIPVFTDAEFNASGKARNLGTIAAEWTLSNRLAPGDNWMLFDDWIVEAKRKPTEPFRIRKIEITPDNLAQLTYAADEGFTYRIEQSIDLKSWSELPNSPVTATANDPAAIHIDPTPADGTRFYRIVRDSGD